MKVQRSQLLSLMSDLLAQFHALFVKHREPSLHIWIALFGHLPNQLNEGQKPRFSTNEGAFSKGRHQLDLVGGGRLLQGLSTAQFYKARIAPLRMTCGWVRSVVHETGGVVEVGERGIDGNGVVALGVD